MKRYFIITILILGLGTTMPLELYAFSQFDGGELNGTDTMCTCSGGQTIKVNSYVDDSQHVYLYQLGVTKLYMNYNIMSMDGYFLTTLTSGATCLVYKGEECDDGGQSPEGIFMEVGTSFDDKKARFIGMLKQFPGATYASEVLSKTISLSRWNISNIKI